MFVSETVKPLKKLLNNFENHVSVTLFIIVLSFLSKTYVIQMMFLPRCKNIFTILKDMYLLPISYSYTLLSSNGVMNNEGHDIMSIFAQDYMNLSLCRCEQKTEHNSLFYAVIAYVFITWYVKPDLSISLFIHSISVETSFSELHSHKIRITN